MSKKHQYLVSSREGQSAVHRKERRKVRQVISAAPVKDRLSRKLRKYNQVRSDIGTIPSERRPVLMNSRLRQSLGAILSGEAPGGTDSG